MTKAKLKKCPHCGSDEGCYVKGRVSGRYIFRFTFDGAEADNSAIHDHLSYKDGKTLYCLNCDKRIAKREDVEL